jgi:hypothetical protein
VCLTLETTPLLTKRPWHHRPCISVARPTRTPRKWVVDRAHIDRAHESSSRPHQPDRGRSS